jgi:hypothetical protein
MELRRVALFLKGFGAGPTEASVETAVLSPAERFKRAGAAVLAGIAVAVIAIPIPIVHFILVPGGLTLGLIFAVIRLRQAEVFRSVRGRCPFCGTEQSFTVMGRFQLPKDVICSNCHRRLELEGRRSEG